MPRAIGFQAAYAIGQICFMGYCLLIFLIGTKPSTYLSGLV